MTGYDFISRVSIVPWYSIAFLKILPPLTYGYCPPGDTISS
jgi:hypothetical protein